MFGLFRVGAVVEKPRNLVGFPGKEGVVSGKEKPPAHDGPGVGSPEGWH
jgi:hypothetical protein